MAARPLYIFDLNGTLCYTSHRCPRGVRAPDGKANKKFYWLRPGLGAFLEKLFSLPIDVAVWTSAPYFNAAPLCNDLFGARLSELAFVYTREQCTMLPDYKSCKDFKEVHARFPHRWSHITLVDDEAYKSVTGQAHLHIAPYDPSVSECHALEECYRQIEKHVQV